jgi:hypothetical protein
MTRESQSSGELVRWGYADVRPYTPVSPPDQKGSLTLMVKEYKVCLAVVRS